MHHHIHPFRKCSTPTLGVNTKNISHRFFLSATQVLEIMLQDIIIYPLRVLLEIGLFCLSKKERERKKEKKEKPHVF
jgi:hypothetical protein